MPTNFIADPDVKFLLQELGGKKLDFLTSLKIAISLHISPQKTHKCLGLIIRNTNGAIVKTVPASIDYDFAEKLYYFCMKKNMGSFTIDSVLTEQVVQIFTQEYDKFITNNVDHVNKVVLRVILKDDIIVSRLKFAILSNKGIAIINSNIKQSIVDKLFEGVISQFDGPIQAAKHKASSVASIAVTKAATVASLAVTGSVSKTIIAKFSVILIAQLKIIVVRALATPAIKAAIVVAVKKVVVAAVLAAFIHVIAAKLGIAVGAAFMWIIVPIVLAFLAKEWWYFPEKIGTSIGDALSVEMNDNFKTLLEQLVKGMFDQVVNVGIIELEKFLVSDKEIASFVNAISKEILT